MDFLDPEVFTLVREIFEQKIPFNRMLGLRLESVGEESASLKFDMREEFIGNYTRRMLHGGVISATLDAAAGLVAFLGAARALPEGSTAEEKLECFSRIGTIDLRVDYLRPGLGKHFIATAYVLRTGSRVAVIRAELHNDAADLIAVGTAAYIVS